VVAAFALVLAVLAVAIAVIALSPDETASTATSPTVPPLTGDPVITAEIPIPDGHVGGAGAVGAGSGWFGISPTHGSSPCHVMRIDLATNEVVAEIPFSIFLGPIAATDDAVWIASHGALDRIDPATDRIDASLPLPGRAVSAIAADETAVWLVTVPDKGPSAGQGILVRVDPATTEIVAEVPLGAQVDGYHDEVRIGGGAVWVLGVRWNESEDAEHGGDLIRVDTTTNKIAARIPVGGFHMVLSADVWVRFPADGVFDSSDESWSWTRVDVVTNEPSAPFAFADDDGLLLVTPDALWAVGYDEQGNVRVTRFDPATLEVVARSELIAQVFTGAVIDPDSGSIWVTTTTDVVRVDIS
jgi:DNA-binding beta-propeller fold protein YncE